MNQLKYQSGGRRSGKAFLICIVIAIILLGGWAGLTKAGLLPNYLDIELLCPDGAKPNYLPHDNGGDPTWRELKPVIYLYPTQEQPTRVKLDYQGELSVTYPAYDSGWEVVAYPDGKILNLSDNREYSYLFWEGKDDKANYDMTTGFVVKGSETAGFLQSVLSEIGLQPVEYNEFIVYWLPQMINNKYNLIHFATKSEYDDRVGLDIEPRPDSVLRVFMVYKKLDEYLSVAPQEFEPSERKGFSVVEWGGTGIE